MELEAIRSGSQFIIPELTELNLDIDKIMITISDEIINNSKKINKSTTYKSLEKLNKDLGGDEFLELKLKNMAKNFKYKESGKTDKETWYAERRDKYEM